MLSINNLSYLLGNRALFNEVSLHIKPKDKIGLIGANGTGKSTLLKLINEDLTADSGTISRSNDCTIGFLNQDLLSYQTDESILEVAMKAFEKEIWIKKEIDRVLHEMEKSYSDNLLHKLTNLQEEFEILGGYSIQSKAEEILEGLGFSTQDLERPLKTFSGGWRMRVMLAKLLLAKPSLLMLDEPTNHLDLPSIQWIEEYLEKYEGAVIIVSHDREFLDRTVKTIVEVSSANLNIYQGNYSFYLEEKALRSEIQKSAYENQQHKIRQTERFIERFKAKASKARQVQSRVKALEKLEIIEDVIDENAKVYFRFGFKTQPGKVITTLDNVSKSFGAINVLENTNITIERGDKIALIGANGKGKSTLLRIIAGTEPVEGTAEIGYNVIHAFYAQHQLEALNVENTLLDELKLTGTQKPEVELRSVLGCFLFSNDDVFKKIKVLSGGEKSRVALAKILISESNFLLLDEPTNHLDMMSVNILCQALQQYEGSYIVVSHDRHFVRNIANKIWYIEDQEIKEYPGSYDEFNQWKTERDKLKKEKLSKNPGTIPAKQENKEVKVQTPKNNPELERFKKEFNKTELKIMEFESLKSDLEKEIAKPEIYSDIKKLEKLNTEYQKVTNDLEVLNRQWEALASDIEKNNQ